MYMYAKTIFAEQKSYGFKNLGKLGFELYKQTLMRQIAYGIAMLFYDQKLSIL